MTVVPLHTHEKVLYVDTSTDLGWRVAEIVTSILPRQPPRYLLKVCAGADFEKYAQDVEFVIIVGSAEGRYPNRFSRVYLDRTESYIEANLRARGITLDRDLSKMRFKNLVILRPHGSYLHPDDATNFRAMLCTVLGLRDPLIVPKVRKTKRERQDEKRRERINEYRTQHTYHA